MVSGELRDLVQSVHSCLTHSHPMYPRPRLPGLPNQAVRTPLSPLLLPATAFLRRLTPTLRLSCPNARRSMASPTGVSLVWEMPRERMTDMMVRPRVCLICSGKRSITQARRECPTSAQTAQLQTTHMLCPATLRQNLNIAFSCR